VAFKFVGVYPFARRWVRQHAGFTTLLMSTGLTFGTISATFGLNAGIIDRAQFSVLVTVVVPTAVAQRRFTREVPQATRLQVGQPQPATAAGNDRRAGP
jgi:hypothetical protein